MRRRLGWALISGVSALALTAVGNAAAVAAPANERISVASDGTQGNNDSFWSKISTDGRYVAFASGATNLVPGATTGSVEIYVRDRSTGTTTLASVAPDGTPANGDSSHPAISGDGRYVAFASSANNLVPGDTNHKWDMFLHDMVTGQNTLVSHRANGDLATRTSNSLTPSLSSDGRYLAYTSKARLAPGDTNNTWDAYVYDRVTGKNRRVSLCADGRRPINGTTQVAISGNGRYVAMKSYAHLTASDTNRYYSDIFVRDLAPGGTIKRVSVGNHGQQGNYYSLDPSISDNGRYVAFGSDANDLVPGDTRWADSYIRDTVAHTTTTVSITNDEHLANKGSFYPQISGNGRYVLFFSYATNLVAGNTNKFGGLYVRDRVARTTSRVTYAYDGGQINDQVWEPAISGDGRYVTFTGWATNIVPDDTNGHTDVFGRNWQG